MQQGMPVAVAEVDRQVDAVGGELVLQGGDERPVLLIDGADAAEVRVVRGDLREAFPRDVAAAGHVFEEREDVVHPLRAAEGEDEQGVVRAGGIVVERRAGTRGALDGHARLRIG